MATSVTIRLSAAWVPVYSYAKSFVDTDILVESAVCSRPGGEFAMLRALRRSSGKIFTVLVFNLSDSNLLVPSGTGTVLGTCTYLEAPSVVAVVQPRITFVTNYFALRLE
ncbi:hypothetical protein MTO96_050596 [Rhipicephalus appendiculatus]